MPELPEVEVVCRQLNKELNSESKIAKLVFHRKDIRYPIPIQKLKKLEGEKIESLCRRGKYLIFKTAKGFIISHLGMSGAWKILPKKDYSAQPHDHVEMLLSNGQLFVYNDPRRFGLIDFSKDLAGSRHLKNLGPEPWSEDFSVKYFYQECRKTARHIKSVLMDGRIVVGVGNIYASEILHKVGIKPTRKAQKITNSEVEKIILQVRETLQNAIELGGSTIQSYQNTYGEEGGFQDKFQVYDREDKKCFVCESKIKMIVLSGRSTYYCSRCQR